MLYFLQQSVHRPRKQLTLVDLFSFSPQSHFFLIKIFRWEYENVQCNTETCVVYECPDDIMEVGDQSPNKLLKTKLRKSKSAEWPNKVP